MESRIVHPARPLRGEIVIPGDKSISHRSIMIGSLAEGETTVHGFLHGEDNHATLKAFRAMGVEIEELAGGVLKIRGRGLDGLTEPGDVLDCGNSGTTIRLMTGLLAGQRFFSVLTGDRYLRKRPMKRVTGPLVSMGARIWGRGGGDLAPLALQGTPLHPIDYASPIASAQVKSALLLAGLYAEGTTTVREPHLSRDHSERMLTAFGAELRPFAGGVSLTGRPRLRGQEIRVPGDISSAAFFLVAALVVPGSELLVKNVGLNPSRSGVIDILRAMGGSLELVDERQAGGEPVADIVVKSSRLKGIEISGELVPRAIDELPVVSIAAALAEGTTTIRDARELRVKETDRIAAMIGVLTALGVSAQPRDDGMVVHGSDGLRGGTIDSCGDHRIAMSTAIAALRATAPVTITDTACTATSFPNFWELLDKIKT
ncbi:MAG: 3-phosphoshikimate 1-carboxyvinyltransferase [Desulfuromonadales bacterium]|nr:3-phosphoshikimate 1-carboxyvinyltransferase [Desulfuromonadales bacterium]